MHGHMNVKNCYCFHKSSLLVHNLTQYLFKIHFNINFLLYLFCVFQALNSNQIFKKIILFAFRISMRSAGRIGLTHVLFMILWYLIKITYHKTPQCVIFTVLSLRLSHTYTYTS